MALPMPVNTVHDLQRVNRPLHADVVNWLKKRGILVKAKISHEQNNEYKECFRLIDVDGSGAIDGDELSSAFKLLGMDFTKREIAAIISEVDDDNTGDIGWQEFIDIMSVTLKRLAENPKGGEGSYKMPFNLASTQYRRKRYMEGIMSGTREGISSVLDALTQEVLQEQKAQGRKMAQRMGATEDCPPSPRQGLLSAPPPAAKPHRATLNALSSTLHQQQQQAEHEAQLQRQRERADVHAQLQALLPHPLMRPMSVATSHGPSPTSASAVASVPARPHTSSSQQQGSSGGSGSGPGWGLGWGRANAGPRPPSSGPTPMGDLLSGARDSQPSSSVGGLARDGGGYGQQGSHKGGGAGSSGGGDLPASAWGWGTSSRPATVPAGSSSQHQQYQQQYQQQDQQQHYGGTSTSIAAALLQYRPGSVPLQQQAVRPGTGSSFAAWGPGAATIAVFPTATIGTDCFPPRPGTSGSWTGTMVSGGASRGVTAGGAIGYGLDVVGHELGDVPEDEPLGAAGENALAVAGSSGGGGSGGGGDVNLMSYSPSKIAAAAAATQRSAMAVQAAFESTLSMQQRYQPGGSDYVAAHDGPGPSGRSGSAEGQVRVRDWGTGSLTETTWGRPHESTQMSVPSTRLWAKVQGGGGSRPASRQGPRAAVAGMGGQDGFKGRRSASAHAGQAVAAPMGQEGGEQREERQGLQSDAPAAEAAAASAVAAQPQPEAGQHMTHAPLTGQGPTEAHPALPAKGFVLPAGATLPVPDPSAGLPPRDAAAATPLIACTAPSPSPSPQPRAPLMPHPEPGGGGGASLLRAVSVGEMPFALGGRAVKQALSLSASRLHPNGPASPAARATSPIARPGTSAGPKRDPAPVAKRGPSPTLGGARGSGGMRSGHAADSNAGRAFIKRVATINLAGPVQVHHHPGHAQ